MEYVKRSSLEEYAGEFWKRQREKPDKNDPGYFQQLVAGSNPAVVLSEAYPYKLPNEANRVVDFVEFTAPTEVEHLLVQSHLNTEEDNWAVKRGFLPKPHSRQLGDLAGYARRSGYFSNANAKGDTQMVCYFKWREMTSLANVLDSRPPLIQQEHEHFVIVDGWGRLLPYMALIQEGKTFACFKAFLATPNGIM